LYECDVQSIIIEGGAYTINQFLDQHLWDEARVLTGKVNFEQGLKAPFISASPSFNKDLGRDTLDIYYRNRG
jgi:diaminohydroxyphosphoribosylaminopyrimidine deaminase/5-amino-6-(5-phosphoribosylamino)uracil reductase